MISWFLLDDSLSITCMLWRNIFQKYFVFCYQIVLFLLIEQIYIFTQCLQQPESV
jgi:hypothetical protein